MKKTGKLYWGLSVSLRGGTLAARFFVLYFLARYLLPADVGTYGLVVATVSYALYVVGLDFYTFSTRELIKSERGAWGGYIKSQAALVVFQYALVGPALFALFAYGALPWSVVGWFFLLLPLEHFAQEINRLLIAADEQLAASTVVFLRLGSWSFVAVAGMVLMPSLRGLAWVFACWCAGATFACFVGIHRLRSLSLGGWDAPVDWRWIRQGVRVAVPLLVSTLALRGLFTIDRYLVRLLGGESVLGAYVLFIGAGTALVSFLDAGVFIFLSPRLVDYFNSMKPGSFKACLRSMALQTLVICVLCSLAALSLTHGFLVWLHRPMYLQCETMLPWTLVAVSLYGLGMVVHYGLYAQGHDRSIIYSHVAGALVFLPVALLLSRYWLVLAVPMSLCVSFAVILVCKCTAFFWLTPAPFNWSLSRATAGV